MCMYGDPKENILSADAQYELELVESRGHLRQPERFSDTLL